MDYISPTQISMYLSCPFRWACKYKYNIEPESKPLKDAYVVGCGLHDIVKELKYASPTGPSFTEIQECLEQRIIELSSKVYSLGGQGVEVPDKNFMQRFKQLFKCFSDNYLSKITLWQNVEYELVADIGGVPVKGYVDYYDMDWVYDLKIKTRKQESFSFPEYIQLGIYSYLTKRNNAKLCIIYYNKEIKYAEVERYYYNTDYTKIINLIQNVYHQINDNKNIFLPSRDGKLCSPNYCEYWKYCHQTWGG